MRVDVTAVAFACLLAASHSARADVVPVEVGACVNKKPGDPCKACDDWMRATCGTCVVASHRCYPESCSHFMTEEECTAPHEGKRCSWGEGQLTCTGAPCVCEENTGERPAPNRGAGASCASTGASIVSLCAIGIAIVFSGGRRSRSRPATPTNLRR